MRIKMKTVKLIGVLLFLPLIVKFFMVSQASSPPLSSRTESSAVLSMKESQSADNWEYIEKRDEATGRLHQSAINMSVNTVDLGSPYAGAQYGKITVTDHGVLFSLERGMIGCGEHCDVLVKFDDNEASKTSAREFGNKSTTIQFTDSGVLDRLKRSASLKIQVDVFQAGLQDFTFNVSGFKQPPRPYTIMGPENPITRRGIAKDRA